jgi:hypothetical protein
MKILMTKFMLLVLATLVIASCETSRKSNREPNFIGGREISKRIPGVTRIGAKDFLFRECTATMVVDRFLLTAAHCFGEDPKTLLNIEYSYPPPIQETVEVVLDDGSLKKENVIVKRIYLYPAATLGKDAAKIPGEGDGEKFGHVVEVGDFAIVELDKPIQGVKEFPKILFQKTNFKGPLWVGGFGKKNQEAEVFLAATYTGGNAQFGSARNSFFSEGDISFKKESEVSFELININQEISYMGKGDSGGGVFSKAGESLFVVGVNHAGRFGKAQGLSLDQTGKVLKRSQDLNGDIIGFAHRFTSSNTKLINWISSILPRDRFVIEN